MSAREGESSNRDISSVLIPIRTDGTRRPLFLVHGLAGTIFIRPDFPRNLHSDQPLYFIQARGVDGEVSPHETVEDMARDYIEAIRSVQPHGPYHLGGFCSGSMVAMEMAHQLAAVNEATAGLIAIDPPMIPQALEREFASQFSRVRRRAQMARIAIDPILRLFGFRTMSARRRSSRQRKQALAEAHALYGKAANTIARRRGETSETEQLTTPDTIKKAAEASAATKRAICRYRPKAFDCRLDIICSQERERMIRSPNLFWQPHFPNMNVYGVVERHEDLFRQGLTKMARRIQICLDDRLDEREAPSPAERGPQPSAIGQEA